MVTDMYARWGEEISAALRSCLLFLCLEFVLFDMYHTVLLKRAHKYKVQYDPLRFRVGSLVITVAFFKCYREKHILVCRHRHNLRIGQNVIASAQLAANLGMPVLDVPLESLCCNVGGFLERDNTNVLAKGVFLAILADLDVMRAGFKQKGQARAREEEDTAARIFGIGLEEVQVVELGKTLVDTAANTSESDNVNSGVFFADPVDGFGEIGRFLIGVADDLRRGGLRRVEVADRWGQGIEVADD
jgi:hypothetical protein